MDLATTLRPSSLLYWLTIIFLLNVCNAVSPNLPLSKRAGEPKVSVNSFSHLPSRLVYLDDTPTVLYHEAHTIHVSLDEGATFTKADSIPPDVAQVLITHPSDNRIAFVLTGGKENWVTQDRGATWNKWGIDGETVNARRGSKSLEFHVSKEEGRWGYVIAYAVKCEGMGWWQKCWDVAYYTKDLFATSHKFELLDSVSTCKFAHSSKDFQHKAHQDLVFCVAPERNHDHSDINLLYASTDFYKTDIKVEDLGMGKNGRAVRSVMALAIVSKFAVVALRKPDGEMLLYVSVDADHFSRAHFPHSSSARLREGAYTILESSTHSLAVDVVLNEGSRHNEHVGTLFVSNSNGTYFVESLAGTNRNRNGFVDFERVYGLDGVAIANVLQGEHMMMRTVKSMITFDDGRNWGPIKAPQDSTVCNGKAEDDCSLHLHSVTSPHNFGRIFSSYAPGVVMGIGSAGQTIRAYADSDTFLSTDGALTWKEVGKGPNKYEFGDSGGILVMVDDDEWTDTVQYSYDFGQTWQKTSLGMKINGQGLTTIPDSTSEKFLIIGQVSKNDIDKAGGRYVAIQTDFSGTRTRQCDKNNDFEKWYARAKGRECLMGHKQFYKRRKPNADCYVGNEFQDPVEHEENCECGDEDYECDYNYILQDGECTPAGPEPVPAGVCKDVSQHYMGSSGYRKIPGNTCVGGKRKDEPKSKPCSSAQPEEGQMVHSIFEFPNAVAQHAYFDAGTTILVLLKDGSFYQSANEGYTWNEPFPGEKFLVFYHHRYSNDRAYLITSSDKFYWTTDSGRTWIKGTAPTRPNTFGISLLNFHPISDYLIWSGERDCDMRQSQSCRSVAFYSTDNGRKWSQIEEYVKNCQWAKDKQIEADPTEILCESYTNKKGNQHYHDQTGSTGNKELIVGSNFYAKDRRRKVFEEVVGFAKFSEYMIVAALSSSGRGLELQVSLDGQNFANGLFPPAMNPEAHAYTILESSTHSLFLHMTMVDPPLPPWGHILKSNSNGTYFGLALAHANRNVAGFVDFEKLVGLDGIALVNIVANPDESSQNSQKQLQSRITHNDGASWKPLAAPAQDSLGTKYECDHVGCDLHIHGYTERSDPRAKYSSPSVVGVVMAVGNVGTELRPYTESDTFLSRDAGFTWEEIHKDAHLWEFGDSGSILIIVNDEEPTDHVSYSINEGKTWRDYTFTTGEKVKAESIVTVPSDTSRRFILFGHYQGKSNTVAIHLDFQALTYRQCVLDIQNSAHDDFELWSPSIEREEKCLFGRQMLYHRRKREADCYVGDQTKLEAQIVERSCACTDTDFECEYNYVKNSNGECVLHEGASPLPNDNSCQNDDEYWYERTPYRKISYSSCESGKRPDRGKQHLCPGIKGHGFIFWASVILFPFGACALAGWWYVKKRGLGAIRLPGSTSSRRSGFSSSNAGLDTLSSIPWFLLGVGSVAYEWVVSRVEDLGYNFRSRRGYRDLPLDEDAQVLVFEDEED